MNTIPPDGLPMYRLITGPDDSSFCNRVSDQLMLGYVLYGSPSIAYDTEKKTIIAAQAIIWPGN
ncbi:Uncharacterized conserved small protein [Yersinia intermedia]|jgi:hypothetical protein|uniref:DUF1737 domain-containing protein n=2 Tax=Yersiniaceae TaxID=1903411 RepID=A0ABX6F983_YERIN|nr:DUF1737 domain-containing protein [Yersinia intermedia]ARB85387.1 DUF1737 domain-containing protein [Yersinia sp. FDAARGOS_228]AJJ18835.1 hypothetical protein CH53_3611 [Yersinia intermedia]AVL35204.1 DUF1737 domain-containing protein [Yersinia intermedia]MCW8111882.1 DUF1737 domain-containing protein [Yersinia intermedia]MDA5516882.1 DUF1737 domain-containing protein [Yersinia intermedia]